MMKTLIQNLLNGRLYMTTFCAHNSKSFNNNPFYGNKNPTCEQINKYKLWKCPTCGKWYSLVGIVKTFDGD